MKHGFIDDRGGTQDWALLHWALALAMLLLPLGGMIAMLAAGVLVGEGFVLAEAPPAEIPIPEVPLPNEAAPSSSASEGRK